MDSIIRLYEGYNHLKILSAIVRAITNNHENGDSDFQLGADAGVHVFDFRSGGAFDIALGEVLNGPRSRMGRRCIDSVIVVAYGIRYCE